MTAPDIDWAALTDEEVSAVGMEADAEASRRYTLATTPGQINDLNQAYHEADRTSEMGSPWVMPATVTEAYPLGWEVTHKNKLWVSTVESNVWEPGVSGWESKPGKPPVWRVPT